MKLVKRKTKKQMKKKRNELTEVNQARPRSVPKNKKKRRKKEGGKGHFGSFKK